MATPAWREIGVLRPGQRARGRRLRRADRGRRSRSRSSASKGLLRLPEVAEVLATLTLLHDLTANAELLDPAHRPALGDRSARPGAARQTRRELAASTPRAAGVGVARRGARPRGGRAPTPPRCWPCPTRWTTPASWPTRRPRASGSPCCPPSCAHLRAHAGEPLLDLVRRIIDTCGIDVELAASVSEAARARRENLDLFVKAVAEFQAIDGDGHACRRCWPGSRPRTTWATASTSRRRARPTRSSC